MVSRKDGVQVFKYFSFSCVRMDTITILTTPLWDVAQCPPGGALGEWTLSGLKVNTDPPGQL